MIQFASKKNAGFTLIELMVALIIISTAILAFIGSFTNLNKTIFRSRATMLASNIAQEKMQILKQFSYYRMLTTPSPSYNTDFDESIAYDVTYFPPENILEGGITFQCLTNIELVQEVNGNFVALPPGTIPDTGIKIVTVTVVWSPGGSKRKIQIKSLVSNPEVAAVNATINGIVTDATTMLPIEGVYVKVAEYMGWMDDTNASGGYSINVFPGSHAIVVSHDRYWPKTETVSVEAGQTQTRNYSLIPKSSGTISSSVWLNDHIVISQICGSTVTAGGTGFNQEYVELFNPTTYTWQMASGVNTPIIGLKYQGRNDASPRDIELIYNTLAVTASSYYLIANRAEVETYGSTITADAVYEDAGDVNTITVDTDPDSKDGCGGVGIYRVSDGSWIDVVGWDRTNIGAGGTAPLYEGDGIDQAQGLSEGEQYLRLNWHIGASIYLHNTYARCFETNNNENDFVDRFMYDNTTIAGSIYPPFPPHNSSVGNKYIISGKPLYGAIVTCNDGMSSSARAGTSYPSFSMSVATGTWTVLISSGNSVLEISSVVVTANSYVSIPNAGTMPMSTPGGYSFLIDTLNGGYVTGIVRNASGVALQGINVTAFGVTRPTSSSGYYTIPLPTGTYSVTANPGSANPLYVSATVGNVAVDQGQITSNINFVLSQGGSLTGWVTRDGVNPLPNVAVIAFDTNDMLRGESVTDSNGIFIILNVSTGTYNVEPALDSGEVASPSAISASLTGAGGSVFVGTFTVSGAYGSISGTVSKAGEAITTGVLIVASQQVIASLPVISTATTTGTPYYMTNSGEDGCYRVEVRGATTTYRVYGYYPEFTGDTPSVTSALQSSVSVTEGQNVTGVNLTW